MYVDAAKLHYHAQKLQFGQRQGRPPRQSAPVEGVTVVITGSGFTAHRITDAEGNAEDVAICAPACALSLDENNTTTLPYAVCSLTARKPGYRTVRIQEIGRAHV